MMHPADFANFPWKVFFFGMSCGAALVMPALVLVHKFVESQTALFHEGLMRNGDEPRRKK